MFRETASRLLRGASADATPPDPRRQAELAVQEALAKGITSFQDAGSSFETVDLLKNMVDDGSLGIRLWVMLRESNEALAARGKDYRMIGYGDNRLTVRAIKRSIDGALGSRGAPSASVASTNESMVFWVPNGASAGCKPMRCGHFGLPL